MSTHPVLPGLHRVMVAESFASRVGVYAGAAYGVSGAVLGPVDNHHRASGALIASVAVQPWLTLALRLDGRYDRHTDLPAAPPTMDGDSDDGWVGEPRLLARASRPLARDWHAAAQLTMWLPGADAPSLVTSAATMDVLAGVSYRPLGSRLRVAVNAGLRLDNSAESVPDVNQLSQADRLSLGASDANALLLGVGASYGVGPVEILSEWTWDVLVGERAPRLGISPMRLAAGARAPLGTGLLGQVAIEVNIADPPVIVVDEPLAPFEPRLSVMAGVHYRFGEPDEWLQRPRRLDSGSAALGSSTLADKAPARAEIPAPQPPALVPVRGQVVSGAGDADGAARAGVAGANVTLGNDERSVTTAADGRFELGELPPGSTRVRVTADGYEPAEQTVTVSAGDQRELSFVLEPMLPAGQLRGLVRSFRGQPLAATLTIEPTGPEVSTGPDGSFELDVAPGQYRVRIRAPGYREQRRKVNIEDGGVTILNVDLRQDR